MELKRRKKSLLEFAMETETYKIVKELLEKYDPEYHRKVRLFMFFYSLNIIYLVIYAKLLLNFIYYSVCSYIY